MTPRPLQKLEQRVARRRLSQARHRATLAGLFGNLRKAVYSHSDLTASKVWGPEGREEKLSHVERLWSRVETGLELHPLGLRPRWVSGPQWTPRDALSALGPTYPLQTSLASGGK